MWKLFLVAVSLVIINGCDNNSNYIEDPLKKEQWYLNAANQYGATSHINLTSPYYKGRNVLVAILDNGIDIYHEDLINNIGSGNYSYLPDTFDFSDADHGTACAGIIAAEEGNGIGIVGIAPQAKIIGFNALRAPAISNLADALVRKKKDVWISNNSWGDFNSWGEPLALRSLVKAALKEGVETGRNGKGIIYVFSSGNGAAEENKLPTDNVNYSGLVNNRFTMPVCAVDEFGIKASYSEIGAPLVVCAPSKGSDGTMGITTTDVSSEKGYNPKLFPDDYENNNYTKNFAGTSASAPMVSGIVALVLEANPSLGWLDVKAILAKSARKTHENHEDWSENAAGLNINHYYGFGIVDADEAIELAENWLNYPDEIILEKEAVVNINIPDNDVAGISTQISFEKNITIEFIDIYFDAPEHPKLGDLEIVLTSPSGTKSILAEQHSQLFEGYFRYNNWRFGSFRHLEEESRGTWKLTVKDKSQDNTGTLKSWRIKIYGHNKRI